MALLLLGIVQHNAIMPIDTDWFIDRLGDRKLSQRGLAKLMNLDPAAISLMLRGKRKMNVDEAAQLATLLQVNVTEVLERSGQPIQSDRRVKVVGSVGPDYQVTMFGEGAHDTLDAPMEAQGCIAIQARTASSALHARDGWIYFIRDVKANPASQLDVLSMSAVKGNGIRLATIKRGYTRGTYNLINTTGDVLVTNVELAWSSPVVWIKTTP